MDTTNSYTDDRGVITDLLVGDSYSVTQVTFNEGAVRGNHKHNKTTQMDTILEGKLLCKTKKPNEEPQENILDAGAVMVFAPGTEHAYRAIDKTVMLSVCFGVRVGSDYEKDTTRLDPPLL